MSGDDAQPPSPPDPIAPPAESPPAPPAEDDLPSGSLGTMNVKTLRKYAEVKGVDVSHCDTRLELIRALSPEASGGDLAPRQRASFGFFAPPASQGARKRPSLLKRLAGGKDEAPAAGADEAPAAGGGAKKRGSFLSQETSEAPAWVQGRRVSVRLGALPPELQFDDDIEHCGNAGATSRELPRHLLDDGFEVPSFDYEQLADVSPEPEGHGCQATVHGCVVSRGQRAGQRFALKILRKELAESEAERKALVREVHFLSRIRHENIVEGLGCGTTSTDGLPCILVGWCETCRARRLPSCSPSLSL